MNDATRTFYQTGLLARSGPVFACLGAVLICTPAHGQTSVDPDGTIVVTGSRPTFDMDPERSIDAADVEAYGLGTAGELLDEIASESGDNRNGPIFLVNGKRVSNLGDVEDLPAEAIAKVEVFPTGSGQKVGGGSSQKVYNITLRSQLDMAAVRFGAGVATRSAWSSRRADASYTHIRGERRVSVTAKVRNEDMLLESERNVLQPAAALPGSTVLRSLTPSLTRMDLGLSVADQLAPWLSGSLNAKLFTARRASWLGAFQPGEFGDRAITQRNRSLSANIDGVLNATVADWLISGFGSYTFDRRRTLTDRVDPLAGSPAISSTLSRSENLSGLLSASGSLFELPAGPLRLTLSASISRDTVSGEHSFLSTSDKSETSQMSRSLNAGIELPIASRKKGILPFLGDLSAGAEISRTHVSDFGNFTTRKLYVSWRPLEAVRLSGSIGRGESAPPFALLGEPALDTPGVLYFDPLRNETVAVTRTTGGLANMLPQSSRTTQISANIKPFRSLALQLTVDYLATSNRNVAAELPQASAAIMQAFPDRFLRDATGRLVAVDARTVPFASRNQRRLRWGFNLNLPLGKAASAPSPGDEDADDGAGSKNAPRNGGVRPRLQINASHTWLLHSNLVIRPGQPSIDLLSPEAVGFGGLGQPRHRIDLSIGYAERGLGLRLTSQYRSASYIEASGSTANVLRFAPLATFSLRGWVQGTRLFPNSRWANGTRFTVAVQNVGDVQERVADRFGVTPLAYQRAYRDPIGRTIEFEFRKTF